MPSPITRRPRWRHARAALSALWITGASPLMAGLVMADAAHAATAPSSPAPDLNASARAEVAQALFSASATSAAAERAADAKLTQQRRQIEQLQAQLKTAGGRNATLLADLTRAQERFVEQLAERDRAYAQSIAVFRRAVQDIAATPEGEAALRQFNAGDEAGALAVLDRMVDARERARKVQADIETAVERRRVATLALAAMRKGKQKAVDVIRRFEEVTRLDPGVYQDWLELTRLYFKTGRFEDAQGAAFRAREISSGDRESAVAWIEFADASMAMGYYREALSFYKMSLELHEGLAAMNPNSKDAKLGVYESSMALGAYLVRTTSWVYLDDAIYLFRKCLNIIKDLLAVERGSLSLRQKMAVALDNLGGALLKRGDLKQGDVREAQIHFEEAYAVIKVLMAAEPQSLKHQGDFAVILGRLGDVAVKQGDMTAARRWFHEMLDSTKKLVMMDQSSAEAQRTLLVSYVKMSEVLKNQGYAQQALDVALEMRRRGILAQIDEWMIDDLKRRVGQ